MWALSAVLRALQRGRVGRDPWRGQSSTYYGKIEDIVLSQEYATPRGRLQTPSYPRSATGPDFDQVMMGSESCFGVLTTVTLRVFRYRPENTRRYSFLFHTWEAALDAVCEVMQGEFGLPSVFRLSDPEETDVAMRMYHIHGTPADTVLRALGYQPMQRCLLLGTADGDRSYTRLVARRIGTIARHYGAFTLTPFQVVQRWEKSRFTDPYLREDLMDFGILIDTPECSVIWSQVQPEVHARVRALVKSRPQTICMTHLSHAYPQGTNLYFIFTGITHIDDYLRLQYAFWRRCSSRVRRDEPPPRHRQADGAVAEGQIGEACMDIVRALKTHFDPEQIPNPGGTPGADMSPEQRAKRWGCAGRGMTQVWFSQGFRTLRGVVEHGAALVGH